MRKPASGRSMVVRSLIFGAAIQFDNGELPYSEHTLKMVHDSIERELLLP